MTRWCTTWRSRACRCGSGWTGPGWWGPDGATHAGSFDLAFLGCLPGMVLMAPSDEVELVHMVATQAAYDAGAVGGALSARRQARVWPLPARGTPMAIGRGRVVREETRGGPQGAQVSRS